MFLQLFFFIIALGFSDFFFLSCVFFSDSLSEDLFLWICRSADFLVFMFPSIGLLLASLFCFGLDSDLEVFLTILEIFWTVFSVMEPVLTSFGVMLGPRVSSLVLLLEEVSFLDSLLVSLLLVSDKDLNTFVSLPESLSALF